MSSPEKPAEVNVIDERFTVTYPKLNVAFYTAIVTYQAGDPVPRTVFIPLDDVAPGKGEQLSREILQRKGDLYKKYLETRTKRIREDIEKAAAFRHETVRL